MFVVKIFNLSYISYHNLQYRETKNKYLALFFLILQIPRIFSLFIINLKMIRDIQTTISLYQQVRIIKQTEFQTSRVLRAPNGELLLVKEILKKGHQFQQQRRDYDIRSTLDHQSVPKCIQSQQNLDRFIYIEEFVQGVRLQQFIQQRKNIEPKLILSIVQKILQAIKYLQGQRIAHRNLTSYNIILVPMNTSESEEYSVKIINFGMAKNQQKPLQSVPKIKHWSYIAPEVMRQIAYNVQRYQFDSRCDIWSLGVITLQMLTNNFLFKASSLKSLYNALNEFRKQSIENYCEKNNIGVINLQWRDFIGYMLVVNYDMRINAEEALYQLRFLIEKMNQRNVKEQEENKFAYSFIHKQTKKKFIKKVKRECKKQKISYNKYLKNQEVQTMQVQN